MKCGDRIRTLVETESIPNRMMDKKRKSRIIPIGSIGKIVRTGGYQNMSQFGIALENGDIIHLNENEIEMLDSPTRKDGLINTKDAQDEPRPDSKNTASS